MASKNSLRVSILRAYWRDTARTCMLGPVDAFVLVPTMIFVLHIRYWTLALLAITILAVLVLQRFGYTPFIAFLAIRSRLAGKRVHRVRMIGRRRLWK